MGTTADPAARACPKNQDRQLVRWANRPADPAGGVTMGAVRAIGGFFPPYKGRPLSARRRVGAPVPRPA